MPPPAIRQLRDLTRYRKRLIQAPGAECQRIRKTLEDAGIKLDSVAADILGVSDRAMLRGLVAGERDPSVLAYDCDDRDLGGDFFVQRDTDRARHRAVAPLQALSYQVTLHPPPPSTRGFSLQDEVGG